MASSLDRTARRIAKAHNKPEAVKQRKNGAEEFRTMFLNNLHRRVGLCMHCGKANCPDKVNTDLPRSMTVDDVLAAIADTAKHCKLPVEL